ncbi:DUF2861 family protein [Vibrio cholerae]|uniref:DUF2861 family protein n=1 Tax=Vibrio cholerae TaxID=666 RepID=UPI0006E4ABEA|nr:DUF2861 family protein [Vibrio cholerae]KQA13065.1 hypothetical protein XM60_15115 [Vibrio cholerae]KQA83816.1 hypothetical protein XV86_01060 [Vibrio cholerae]KQA92919.1 hypothetical protein XV88_01125 [Vibrio cholerae]PAR75879.1 DUF2861 domain-containing protein [Vibrio cholerae]PAR85479.1 DUF2861 domain-containing protein [Vibrio cholerae]
MIRASFHNHIVRFVMLSALISGAAIAETPPSPIHAWFRATPLQTSYQQLAEGHPMQAWHELIHTLSTTPVAEAFWQPIKEAILSQTQCGQALPNTSPNDLSIAVTFIHKFNQTFQGYQVRLSAENLTQPLAVRLTSAQGATVLEAELAPADYAEVESRDLLSPYAAGVYWLTLGEQRIALLISAPSSTPWIEQSSATDLTIRFPATPSGCASSLARWQFFDQNFTLLHSQTVNRDQPPAPPSAPSQAHWRSLSITQSEYQGTIRVEQMQRLTIPID